MNGNKISQIFGILCTFWAVTLIAACDTAPTSQDGSAHSNSQDSELSQQNFQQSQQAEEADIIEGEYIVTFEEQSGGVISAHAAQVADQLRHEILSAYSIHQDSVLHRYRHAIKGFAAKLSDKQVEALRNDPRVTRVSPNVLFRLAISSAALEGTSPDTSEQEQSIQSNQVTPWGVKSVGGPVLNVSYGKTAWILDSGVDLDHRDLYVNTTDSRSFILGENPDDGFGHGTHVAGIIAAKDNFYDVVGVAAGASVVSVKVCYNDPLSGCPESSMAFL